MKIIVKSTGEHKTAEYITTKSGNKRMSVDGVIYSDKKFDSLFELDYTDSNLLWKSNVKALFTEIISNGGASVAACHTPLKITFAILRKVAKRANELQDPELNSLMASLCLYEECDPYSPDFKGFYFLNSVIRQDPELYK